MFTERELLILSFAMSELIKARPAAFFPHTDADKLLDKVHVELQRLRLNPSPALIRAAKAQWVREAQQRKEEDARLLCEHLWAMDEYNIDVCTKCGVERGE